MKKYTIIASVLIFILGGGSFILFKNKSQSIKKQLEKIESQLESYYLEGNMKMLDGDDLKDYLVKVNFLKYEENDYFKVELRDKISNQEQIIIKNNEGVYVVTPALNRAFQFKSEWPHNSPKPYIYQSLLKMFNSEYTQEKSKDGYLIEALVTYTSNPNIVKQEVKFNKDLHPVYVNVLNAEDVELIQLEITNFEMNPKIEIIQFDVYNYVTSDSNTNQSGESEETATISELPLYPVEVMGSVLVNEDELIIDGMVNHILQFDGVKSFTIVAAEVSISESFIIEPMNGDLIDLIDSVAVYNNNELQVIGNGIISQIYSNDLTLTEMISIINSMQNMALK